MTGPREEDGDYEGEFFGTYEREADRMTWWPTTQTLPCLHPTPQLHNCASCREQAAS